VTCPFYHKLCGACKKYVCRGYFPEKQPYIKNDMTPTCIGNNYKHECLIYSDAVQWREARRRKSLDEHCPFAANAFCGKPWLWMCKGAVPPFALTEIETDPQGRTIRGKDGDIIYKAGRSVANIKGTCLSGDTKIYEKCPSYKMGVEYRKYVKQVKKGESS